MKPVLFLLGAMVCLVPAEAKSKVAILNVQKAIISTQDGKTAAEELQRKFAPDQARLSDEQREIETLEKQLKDAGGRTDEATASLKARITTLIASHHRRVEDAGSKFEQERIRILKELGIKLRTVVEKYAKQKHFEVVLDESDPKAPVFWRATIADITDEVIKRYDQASKTR
jgi:outer membrane protein